MRLSKLLSIIAFISLDICPAVNLHHFAPIPKEADLGDSVEFTQVVKGGMYVMAGTSEGNVYLWHTITGKFWHKVAAWDTDESHPKLFTGMAVTPDGKYLFVAERYIHKWTVAGNDIVRLDPWMFLSNSERVAVSPDGNLVVVTRYLISPLEKEKSSSEVVQLFTADTGKLISQSKKHYNGIGAVAFSVDGNRLLVGDKEGIVHLLNRSTGQEIRQFDGHTGPIKSIAFSPTGEYILSGSEDKTARLWKSETGKMLNVWQGIKESVHAVAFSPNGRYVLTASDTITLWSFKTGSKIREYKGHIGSVESAAFSLDGKYLISGGDDRTARLWNVATGVQIRFFTKPK